MKQTPFTSIHKKLGAKLVPFGGYEMPVQYAGIIEEHKAVRSSVGVFDVSHMGEFTVTGKNALAYLQKVTVNDVSKLKVGEAQYSAICNDGAGIIDDLLVYRMGDERYMAVVNASNIVKDFGWMERQLIPGVSLTNDTDEIALLAVQGPNSQATLQKITSVDLGALQYYHFSQGTVAGAQATISRTGYTGELGYEIYFPPLHAESVWKGLFEAGKEFNIVPVGLGARDTLRLEMGYCLYGNDIDESTNTLEAGLGWITKLAKGEFVGRSVLERAKREGLKRKLVGIRIPEKAVPRHGYAIEAGGGQVGSVTSGTFSPSLEQGIAMGYVAIANSSVGTPVRIDIRGRGVEGTVTALPFYKR
ncbi:MAG TPA: glycine cleavage system aminomethyltransferase GcvT [Bacteroidota bacterium]|nr:glycine cleavage system aminomethyltransferase GcvT [Bacteroidota bacterium]